MGFSLQPSAPARDLSEFSLDRHAAAKPGAQEAQFVEGEPDDFVRLSCVDRGGGAVFCGAAGIAGQTDEEDQHRDGQGQAAGEAQGTGKAKGRTPEGGNAQARTGQGGGGGEGGPATPDGPAHRGAAGGGTAVV